MRKSRKEYQRKRRAEHPEKYKAYYFTCDQKRKNDALSQYSTADPPSCAYCGVNDQEVLCIDHINNNGKEQRKRTGLGSRFYQWLRVNSYPAGYQVLCFNCNHKKEVFRRRGKNYVVCRVMDS